MYNQEDTDFAYELSFMVTLCEIRLNCKDTHILTLRIYMIYIFFNLREPTHLMAIKTVEIITTV